MIFVDSNVPMYLVGAAHPHKTDAQFLLERSVATAEGIVTDAEVLQEILHRYISIGRVDAIDAALEALLDVVDQVFPIEGADVLRARQLLRGTEGLSARDSLHLAIMERYAARRILTFDADFDRYSGVTRIFQV